MELAIINHVTQSGWYPKGQRALRESLGEHRPLLFSSMDGILLRNAWEDKIYAIKQAAEIGFKKLLWLDASITLIPGKTLDPIFEYIEKNGVYLYPSGYKSGQTANLEALKHYDTNTNEQMSVTEVASNVVGINLESEVGENFLRLWVSSLGSDANLGKKQPGESEAIKENPDPRFLFSRQDQSTATLSAWRCEAPIDMDSLFVFREGETPQKETSIFRLKGL